MSVSDWHYHAVTDDWRRLNLGHWEVRLDAPIRITRPEQAVKIVSAEAWTGPAPKKTIGDVLRGVFGIAAAGPASPAVQMAVTEERKKMEDDDVLRALFDDESSTPSQKRWTARSQYELAKTLREAEEKAAREKIEAEERRLREEELALKAHYAEVEGFGRF